MSILHDIEYWWNFKAGKRVKRAIVGVTVIFVVALFALAWTSAGGPEHEVINK